MQRGFTHRLDARGCPDAPPEDPDAIRGDPNQIFTEELNDSWASSVSCNAISISTVGSDAIASINASLARFGRLPPLPGYSALRLFPSGI